MARWQEDLKIETLVETSNQPVERTDWNYFTEKLLIDWKSKVKDEADRFSDVKNAKTIIGVAKSFDWGGGANHKSHAMTSSETSNEEFFVGAKIS